jgi:hypothetical protein
MGKFHQNSQYGIHNMRPKRKKNKENNFSIKYFVITNELVRLF